MGQKERKREGERERGREGDCRTTTPDRCSCSRERSSVLIRKQAKGGFSRIRAAPPLYELAHSSSLPLPKGREKKPLSTSCEPLFRVKHMKGMSQGGGAYCDDSVGNMMRLAARGMVLSQTRGHSENSLGSNVGSSSDRQSQKAETKGSSLRLSPFGSVKLSVNSPFDDCESPFTFTFTFSGWVLDQQTPRE